MSKSPSKADLLRASLECVELEEKLEDAKAKKGWDGSKGADRKLKDQVRETRRRARELREKVNV